MIICNLILIANISIISINTQHKEPKNKILPSFLFIEYLLFREEQSPERESVKISLVRLLSYLSYLIKVLYA